MQVSEPLYAIFVVTLGDGLPPVAPIHHMINRPGILNA